MQVHFIVLNNEPQKCQLTYVCVVLESAAAAKKKEKTFDSLGFLQTNWMVPHN